MIHLQERQNLDKTKLHFFSEHVVWLVRRSGIPCRTACGIRVGLDQRSCATSDPVSSRMGDRLWTGKPSRYVTSQL